MHAQASVDSRRALKMDALPFQERFLIWAFRISFSPVIPPDLADHHIAHVCRFLQTPEILPWLQNYIGAIGTTLHGSRVEVDIHSPACPMVGRVEWHLIQTLAALQANNRGLAEAHLEAFLPASAIQVCTDCAVQLSMALDRAGWALQLMPVTRSELLEMPSIHRRYASVEHVLH